MISESSGKRKGVFYGWIMLAGCVVSLAVAMGVRFSFGVFFTALESEFGWSRAMTSGIFSVYLIFSTIFAILGGWVVDRYGPRLVLMVMGFFITLSLFLSSLAQSVWQLYLSYGLLLGIGTGATYTITMATGSRWFVKQRGLALGIIGSGVGVGTIITPPIAAYLVSVYDWRTALVILALAGGLLTIPVALLLRKEPGEIGILPDGEGPASIPIEVRPPTGNTRQKPVSLREAMQTRNFWLLSLLWFAYAYCLGVVMTHVPPRAEDVGLLRVEAASIISLVGAANIPARIIVGRLSDRIGNKPTAIVFAFLHAIALLWLIWSTKLWMFYLFAIVFGFAYGGLNPPTVALIADAFGLGNMGLIMASIAVGYGLGFALGPYLTGLIFDTTGSYSVAFLIGVLAMVLASSLFALLLRTPAKEAT